MHEWHLSIRSSALIRVRVRVRTVGRTGLSTYVHALGPRRTTTTTTSTTITHSHFLILAGILLLTRFMHRYERAYVRPYINENILISILLSVSLVELLLLAVLSPSISIKTFVVVQEHVCACPKGERKYTSFLLWWMKIGLFIKRKIICYSEKVIHSPMKGEWLQNGASVYFFVHGIMK